jgi:hypothetical protein
MIRFGNWRRWVYRKVLRINASPHKIARGFALGVVVGLVAPPGVQIVAGLPVALLLRGNVVSFAVGTLITNPVTYVPIYLFTCRVGQLFLNLCGGDFHLAANLKELIESVAKLDLHGLGGEFESIALCWLAGGLLVGLAFSVPAYYLAYLLSIEVQKLAEFSRVRRAKRAEGLLKRLAQEEPPSGRETSPKAEAPEDTREKK